MDASSLLTASNYINNLLLARGLLREGKPVEFDRLATTSDDGKRHADTEASSQIATQVINLVHDLVLRRDRDQEQHETLAFTLRSLRTDAVRNTGEVERLKDKNHELTRQIALAQSSVRTAQTTTQSAEASGRRIRAEAAHLKTLLLQVRTQCANDIRKRDVQLQRLKSHLEAQQRGTKAPTIAPSVKITPGTIGRGVAQGPLRDQEENTLPNVEDIEYNLRQESTEFLTQLSQGLSDENDRLLDLVRSTVDTLRELQGLPHNQHDPPPHMSQGTVTAEDNAVEDMVHVVPTSFDILSTDLQRVMANLNDLLTNPSFAPIEEVHTRDEEIQRLREGWERMEDRWQEALTMMQGWRKRMLSGGGNVNLEELKLGLGLGKGLQRASPRAALNAALTTDSMRDFTLLREDEPDLDASEDMLLDADDLPEEESSFDTHDIEPPVLRFDSAGDRKKDHAAVPPLREIAANANGEGAKSKAAVSCGAGQENHKVEDHKATSKPRSNSDKAFITRKRRSFGKAKLQAHKTSIPKAQTQDQKLSARARLGVQKAPSIAQPRLSVEQKLKHAEREAHRVSSPCSTSLSDPSTRPASEPRVETVEENRWGIMQADKRNAPSPVKRTRIAGRPRRRKSTLSPDELEALMTGTGRIASGHEVA